MKNAVFWHVTPCGSCKERRFGGTYQLYDQGDKNGSTRNNVSISLQPKHDAKICYVTTNVCSSPSLVTLMMEAISSSEMSVVTRTRRHSPYSPA
jgi:hypothetical protein